MTNMWFIGKMFKLKISNVISLKCMTYRLWEIYSLIITLFKL